MATGQTLLDLCETLDNEMELQAGEDDVVSMLRALNAAQDAFEATVAQHPEVLGSDVGTLTITADTETTAFPSALLRLDGVWMLDTNTSRPIYKLEPIYDEGSHTVHTRWPLSLVSAAASGRVTGFHTNGRMVYWSPFPSQGDTVRWHGFSSAPDITADGLYTYPDTTLLPMAAFGVKLVRAGWGDDSMDLGEAYSAFGAVVKQMAGFWRPSARPFSYNYTHRT